MRSRDRVNKKISVVNGAEIIARRVSYEFNVSFPKNINPFFLSRKAERFKGVNLLNMKIKSIEYIGEKEALSFVIEGKDQLYLTDGFMVAHT